MKYRYVVSISNHFANLIADSLFGRFKCINNLSAGINQLQLLNILDEGFFIRHEKGPWNNQILIPLSI